MNVRKGIPLTLVIGALAACGGDDPEPATTVEQAPVTEPAEVAAPAPAATGPAQPARAVLRNREGQEVGDVSFAQEGNEVVITMNGRNFEGGPKAVHIHAIGQCEGPTFASAGDHFNPTNRQHGLNNPQGPHAGDLPNVIIDPDDGVAHDILRTDRVTLVSGQPNSLLDADGSAIVFHVSGDDGTSQPAGNSGDPVVCGVITPS
jgi:Cu-Zn family superoxide dismutase